MRLFFRGILSRKATYLAAAGILSLGIGMSLAMFSLVDAVLIRPLPFPRQRDIHLIWKVDPLAGEYIVEMAYPELHDLQASLGDVEYAAVMTTSLYGYARVLQSRSSESVQIESGLVSHDFFRVLGVSPALGRDFLPEDEQVGAAPVVVLSHGAWSEYLGSDPSVIGRTIRLNGQGHTVIGVMPAGVEFPRGAGLWVPLGVQENIVEDRGATWLQAIVRTKPGVSRERIAREVNLLFGRLAMEYPDAYSASQQGVVTPLVEYWTGTARVHLSVMLAASGLLLVASIVSSGHLLLSSVLSRRSEFATRAALGARPGRILRELGLEGTAIAILAVVVGWGVARAAVGILVRSAPPDIPRLAEAALDARAFSFAAGAATLAAIACTVVPALLVARLPLESALKEGGARLSISYRTERVRRLFLLAQAAGTVTLLVMAVLLVVSYRRMVTADTGFANRDAVSMNLQLRGPGLFASQAFDPEFRRSFYRRLLEGVREETGVTSAAAVLLRPLEGNIGWERSYEFEFETGLVDERVLPRANYEAVTPDYFRTVGTPLLEGRDFDERDSEDGEPVVIVSRALGDRIRASGYSPLGHRVRLDGSGRWMTVIGVVADARYRNITQPGADIFIPYSQTFAPTNYVVVRGTQSPDVLADLVRRKLAEMDPDQTVAHVATLGELMDRNAARHRFNMTMLVWLGICAAVLAAAGVYTVVSEASAARERELMIRSALGAGRARLVGHVISRALVFVLMGEALGMLAAISIGGFASELLYGVSARDPVVLGSVATFVFLVSWWAAFWPAWSATAGRSLGLRVL
jgi:predicted permease